MEPRPDDELASALLDEEVTEPERARATSDPAVVERVEALRAARDLLRTEPAPLDPAVADAQIARAVAAADSWDRSGADEHLAPVVPLRRRAAEAVAAVAAVAVLVIAGSGLLADEASQQFSSVGASISAGGGQAFAPSADADDAAAEELAGTIAPEVGIADGADGEVETATVLPGTVPTSTVPGVSELAAARAAPPVLEPLPPVDDDAALANALRTYAVEGRLAEEPAPPGPGDLVGGPTDAPCEATEVARHRAVVQVLLALHRAGGGTVLAEVPSTVGDEAVRAVALGDRSGRPTGVAIVVPVDRCGAPRVVSAG